MEVVSGGALVASAVRLAARLDPDESILQFEARVGGGAETKPSSPKVFMLVNYSRPGLVRMSYLQCVAPVSPRGLACRLLAGTALVRDEVCAEPFGREERSESLHVVGLVIVGVT